MLAPEAMNCCCALAISRALPALSMFGSRNGIPLESQPSSPRKNELVSC